MIRAFVALLMALLLVYASPVAAESTRRSGITLRDGVGDVWTTPTGGDSYVPAPERRVGDVTRMRAVHRRTTVVVVLRFAELRRTGKTSFEFGFRTDRGVNYAQISASRRQPAGRHRLWALTGDRIDCRMGHTIDYARELVRLRIPRSCLDAPRWVRVRQYTDREIASTLSLDNPHNGESHPDGLTPRLYRR